MADKLKARKSQLLLLLLVNLILPSSTYAGEVIDITSFTRNTPNSPYSNPEGEVISFSLASLSLQVSIMSQGEVEQLRSTRIGQVVLQIENAIRNRTLFDLSISEINEFLRLISSLKTDLDLDLGELKHRLVQAPHDLDLKQQNKIVLAQKGAANILFNLLEWVRKYDERLIAQQKRFLDLFKGQTQLSSTVFQGQAYQYAILARISSLFQYSVSSFYRSPGLNILSIQIFSLLGRTAVAAIHSLVNDVRVQDRIQFQSQIDALFLGHQPHSLMSQIFYFSRMQSSASPAMSAWLETLALLLKSKKLSPVMEFLSSIYLAEFAPDKYQDISSPENIAALSRKLVESEDPSLSNFSIWIGQPGFDLDKARAGVRPLEQAMARRISVGPLLIEILAESSVVPKDNPLRCKLLLDGGS